MITNPFNWKIGVDYQDNVSVAIASFVHCDDTTKVTMPCEQDHTQVATETVCGSGMDINPSDFLTVFPGLWHSRTREGGKRILGIFTHHKHGTARAQTYNVD